MRKFILIALFTTFVFANEQLKKYDKLFENFKTQRIGLEQKEIESAKDPFIKQSIDRNFKMEPTRLEQPFALQAILDNRAKIDGVWRTIGDSFGGYKVLSVDAKGVSLSKQNGEKIELKLVKDGKIEIKTR
ncbi:hypothetical protein [Campylobacter mucosalis]|uniref:hypothetical protein n=1 Tax=Campylobacter mucosalis TaxID=202 RepID=UPI001470677D|nr:hypothetical protein [Campylobacter mucosalis]